MALFLLVFLVLVALITLVCDMLKLGYLAKGVIILSVSVVFFYILGFVR